MNQFVKHFCIKSNNRNNQLYIAACGIPYPSESNASFIDIFHPSELDLICQMKYQKRKHNFYLSRSSAKLAASQWNRSLTLNQIQIRNGYFSHPYICCKDIRNVSISISHCQDIGISVSFPDDYLIGIDLELNQDRVLLALKNQLTQHESTFLDSSFILPTLAATILWTAKEALSKALRIGFTSDLSIFEVETISLQSQQYISQFRYFPQFKAYSLYMNNYIFTIVLPIHIQPLPLHEELSPSFSELFRS